MTRRTLLAALVPRRPFPFGFTLYSMKTLPVAEAMRVCAGIGYDAVELCLLDGWPRLEAKQAREAARASRLTIPAMMEKFSLVVDDAEQSRQCERIAAAGEYARVLGSKPVLETVVGGKPEQWEPLKQKMAERLREWARAAERAAITVAIKAHVGAAVERPDQLRWLWKQAASERIKLTYDYSHFQLVGLGLAESLDPIIQDAVFVHVKDGRGDARQPRFLLAGEGTIDYVDYFRRLRAAGYRGPVIVEVSAQIFQRPGYDPVAAARQCHAALIKAL